jgi:quercetin dioxygenase-like cupin family protein
VGTVVTRGAASDRGSVDARFHDERLSPTRWSAGPRDPFAWHAHDRAKVLFVLRGSIEFWDRTEASDELRPFDRLDLEAGTEHRAVAGPEGVECVEAFR